MPISALADALLVSVTETQEANIPYFMVGHVGDGNFHMGYLIDPNTPAERETAERLNHQLVERAIKRALDPLNIMNPGKIFSL